MAPTENHKPITKYEVVILDKADSTYKEDAVICDGLAQVTLRYCIIEMGSLRTR